jgi:adenylosuccinate lyase
MDPLWDRYPSKDMLKIWTEETKFSNWRKVWFAVAKIQKELGMNYSDEQIADLEKYIYNLNLERANEIEKKIKHDVMSHIRAYGEQAESAKGIIHAGLTSCDVTDNAELMQIRDALNLIIPKVANAIDLTAKDAEIHKDLMLLGYTHYQPAQPPTLGKRISMWGYQFLMALQDLEYRKENFKGRGVKGATGTMADTITLLGSKEKAVELDKLVAKELGFKETFPITGQTYPKLFVYQMVSTLAQIAIAAEKAAIDIRLMQHDKEVEEPFSKDQVGSSAMPYKRNPMASERICSLGRYSRGLVASSAETAAVQWLERSLDNSAIERLIIPDAFLSADAILEVYLRVMDGLVVNHKIIEQNLMRELPFMAINTILMEAVKKGGDRNYLHGKLKQYAMEAGDSIKQGKSNNLLQKIEDDKEIPLNAKEVETVLKNSNEFIGRSVEQADYFLKLVEPVRKKYTAYLGIKSESKV